MGREREGYVDAFRGFVAQAGDRLELFDAAALIALLEYPDLRVDVLKGELDAWARAARAHALELPGAPKTAGMLASVCHVLFREVGLKGNREAYTDPRNSFLNEVMQRHLGLPITLSVLFVEVARRVGLAASGVAFPGHFLARVEDPNEPDAFVVVDSFSGGNIMGLQDLNDLLARNTGNQVALVPHMLVPATTRSILVRMLRNLKASYTERDDYGRALLAQERILALCDDEPGEFRDHGLLLASANEPGAAVQELEKYMALAPDAADAAEVRSTIRMLREQAFSVN